MPTYEYKCRKCSFAFERFQKMTDEPVKTCPKCGGEVERLISAGGGLIFKGSGFYSTDYRSESYKRKAREESTSPVKEDKKEKSQTESKSS
ncbi:MAG TPA: zinc ribbon domain-containing protein [Terriglobales bacterium]|nr:zinc ribbon domain-containing protein [Terriglobales bacterium]